MSSPAINSQIYVIVHSDPRQNAEFSREDKAAIYVSRLLRSGVKLEDIEVHSNGIELDLVDDYGISP